MNRFFLLSAILLLLFSAIIDKLAAREKTDTNIVGHIRLDNQHAPFANVSIKGTTIGTLTDGTGHFTLINVPVGTLTVVASCVGCKTGEQTITTKLGETSEIKFELEEDVLNIDEVIVSSNRNEQRRSEAAMIVNTLSSKLLNTVQSVTLSDGLNYCPGLRMENNCQNCGFTQVRMNGMEGPYSQILINSRPVFSGLAGVYGLELIPANMIERVEIVRGGGSALYGSNAIAGTINLILKDPVSNVYELGISGGLTGIGMKDKVKPATDYSVNFNASIVSDDRKTGLALYGFTREREPFDANGDQFSEISSMENITIGSRFFHRFGHRSKLAIDFFNIKEDRAGGNRPGYPLHERDVAEAVKHDIKSGAITYDQFFREMDLLSVFASGQLLHRDSYYGANRSLSDYGNSKDFTSSIGIQYKAMLNNGTITGGVERTSGHLVDQKMAYPDLENAVIEDNKIIEIPHSDNTLVADQSLTTTGSFLQYELKFNNITALAGGRLDHYKVVDHAKNNEAKTGLVFSPRLSLMASLIKNLQLRASYSQGYRAPQIFDEDLHIETSGSRQVINLNDPDLEQETSSSYMLSLDYNRRIGSFNTSFLIEGFFTRLNNPFVNEIGTPDEHGTVYYTRKNAKAGAKVKGVNTEFKLKPSSDFGITTGFTLQKSKFEEEQEFDEKRFFRTPEAYGFLTLDWDFVPRWCLSASGNYTGPMLVPYFGPHADPDHGVLRQSKPFFEAGSKISYTHNLNGAKMQWYVGMKNFLNAYQDDFDSGIDRDPSYMYGPLTPRMIYFGIKIGNRL